MKKNDIITFRPTPELKKLLEEFYKEYPYTNKSALINNALTEYIVNRLMPAPY